MKVLNRKELYNRFPQNYPLYSKEYRFFYVDHGIVPFRNKHELRCFIMTQIARRCALKGEEL